MPKIIVKWVEPNKYLIRVHRLKEFYDKKSAYKFKELIEKKQEVTNVTVTICGF